jgi:predicted acylesterase/phospholipase RssA
MMMMRRAISVYVGWVVTIGLVGCSTLRDTRQDHRVAPMPPVAAELAGLRSVQERDDGQNPELAMAVAISGGGHRSANFAVGVMLALESLRTEADGRDLLREIDYLSTVSGGGFAAGVYVSTLHAHLQGHDGAREGYALSVALDADDGGPWKNLRRDYQNTVFEEWFNVSCLGHLDAGDLLQRRLGRYVLGDGAGKDGEVLRMGDMFREEGGADVQLPYWVPNATIYENGARFAFVPATLAHYGVSQVPHGMGMMDLQGEVLSTPMAVGVRASASFPVVFPATTLGCTPRGDELNPYLHLLDGGLSDNLGYRTALELLAQDAAPRKVLLVIDAYKGISMPRSASERSPAGVEAAYRTMTIRLDSEHAHLRRELELLAATAAQGGARPVEIVVLGFEEIKPLLEGRVATLEQELLELRNERSRVTLKRLHQELDELIAHRQNQLERANEMYDLYHKARDVETSLHISRREQDLLVDAGRQAVMAQRDRLLQLLK